MSGSRNVCFPPIADARTTSGVSTTSPRDAEACRSALASLVSDYVRQYPAQCRYLALPRWQRNTEGSGAAVPEEPALDAPGEGTDTE